jgi:hypothetical protein
MIYQPPNPNPRWPNENTLYLGIPGSGKSQAMEQNPAFPKAGANVVLWDQAGDHAGTHYSTRSGFLDAVMRGVSAGRGFRVAFSGAATVENYEWWCAVVWGILDGKRRTYAGVEELQAVCPSTATATPNAAILLNQGRKFGLVFHAASPRAQEVAKTYYDNCPVKFVGTQRSSAMRRKFAEEMDIRPDDLRALQPLQFFKDDGGIKGPERVQLQYRKPQGVVWK